MATFAKVAAIAALVVGGLMLACVLLAPELVDGLIARVVTKDGTVNDGELFALVLYGTPLWLLLSGLVVLRLAAASFFDPRSNDAFGNGHRGVFIALFLVSGMLCVQYLAGCILFKEALAPLCRLYVKEGPYEYLTALLFIVAGLWLATAVKGSLAGEEGSVATAGLLGLLAFGCIVVGMEEISWGQTLFQWSTPDAFAGNQQDETNFHNYFNHVFRPAYTLLAFAVILVVAAAFELRRRGLSRGFHPAVLPNANLTAVALWMPPANWLQTEAIELLAALMAVLYTASTKAGLAKRAEMARAGATDL